MPATIFRSCLTRRGVILGFATLALMLGFAHSVPGGEVYKWVDDKGGIHYTDYPPRGYDAERVSIQGGISRGAVGGENYSAGGQQGGGEGEGSASTESAKADQCARLEENIAALKNQPKVYVEDPERGERRLITAEEREQRLADDQQAYQEFCGE